MHCGCLHTGAVAGGPAVSSPLTWHVALRLPGAGRDHVEDLGGASVGGAVGPLGDAGGRPGPRRGGDGVPRVLAASLGLRRPGVLAPQCWRGGEKHMKGSAGRYVDSAEEAGDFFRGFPLCPETTQLCFCHLSLSYFV